MWVDAVREFGFELFQALNGRDGGRNIFFSPLGLARALSLLCNGAQGETQRAIAQVLRSKTIDLQRINRANAELKESLCRVHVDVGFLVSIADSIWIIRGSLPKQSFVQLGRDYYEAAVKRVNQAEALEEINTWARRSTNGRIQEIIAASDLPFDIALINTVLFKGSWKVPFDEAKTRQYAFRLVNGAQKPHPLMFRTDKYRYFKDPRFAAIEVPFGADRFYLCILMPDADVDFKQFLRSINARNWADWTKRFESRNVNLGLPKLDLEYNAVFNDALETLGMGVAFEGRADFSNLMPVPPPQRLSLVKQKTFLKFDEQGAEAGSATAVIVGKSFADDIDAIDMVVERPFFCAIRDTQTQAILFLGSVTEP